MFYKLSADGNYIEMSTPFEDVAQDNGMDLQTDEEIVYDYLGRLQLKSQCPEPPVEWLQEKVRTMRNSLLQTEIDPVVTNPLRWNDMSDEQKAEYTAYRKYLLDYTQGDNWWTKEPLTLDEWKKEQ